MTWGAIGALIGGLLGVAFGFTLNRYGLGVLDWVQQDYLSGGTSSPTAWGAVGAVAGGFMGLILSYVR